MSAHGNVVGQGFKAKVAGGGLKMWSDVMLTIGDHSADVEAAPPENWNQTTPFKGKVIHFSAVGAKNANEIDNLMRKRFKGKKLRFAPPPAPEPKAAEEKKPAEPKA